MKKMFQVLRVFQEMPSMRKSIWPVKTLNSFLRITNKILESEYNLQLLPKNHIYQTIQLDIQIIER